ncbi:peptidoglycan-binding domain-containing protein [Fodinibius sp.]|uniref:peptidoglycan-binding domain-containing protein n=1 Tax=Fodinibius sp. TaxID=1872440 RepID=UPI002ACDB06D|nr:peptidoglycan-binding domain-containing protein [Fodinibius sp.]MDZ7658840.1 peptidoglycan-binding domain-containing protein [Fodinibius sp.]
MSSYLGQQSTAIQVLSDSEQRILRRSTPMMQGADVRKVQEKLGIETDGMYGPVTEQAVKNFQQEQGLTVDGIVGPNTWKALKKVGNGSPTALSKVIPSGLMNTVKDTKASYWDPLSTTEKAMYGGGAVALLFGIGVAVNKRN